ncbi:hypothetical protein ANCCAN_03764 [Ancylostoma caninum]|uniref:Uncharacterized protein n=1 Tax=Ancylostoma caninum TaxID=29170 RepID=A0A368H3F0_ANCCA|nr:hypothetical protein ANCCAN_03764 [Ancylostoma caninum]
MSTAILVANAILFLILVLARKRLTAAFFRILNVLVFAIIFRNLTTIILKLPSLWFRALITDETIISLIVGLLSKYLFILLVFLLSLNRFSVIVCPALDEILFSG